MRLVAVLGTLALVGALLGAAAATTPNEPVATSVDPSGYAGLEGGPTGAGQLCDGPAVVCPPKIAFGLSTKDSSSLGPVFQQLAGALDTPVSLVGSYQDFTEPFDVSRIGTILHSGRTPLITWEPFRSAKPTVDSFPLADIASGRFDHYLQARAAEIAQVPGSVIIRFGHEMNGFWYPWGQPRPLHPQNVAASGNTPDLYRAAYRHVVDLFRAAGVTNVAWMWSPNLVDANAGITLASLYPGDQYVDVVGVSGYLSSGTQDFADRFGPTLSEVTAVAPSKPLIIAETGVVAGSARVAQLADLVKGIVGSARVTGFVYFSQPDQNVDYQLSGDTASLAALSSAVRGDLVERELGDLVALPFAPTVTGSGSTPLVGDRLSTALNWRGVVSRSTVTWSSCPAAVLDDTCATRGYGTSYPISMSDRGRFLIVSFGTLSPGATASASSLAVGPVRVDPPAVPLLGIDLQTGAVRLRFDAPAEGVTDWLIKLDDGDVVYQPSSTATYFLKGLALGSQHHLEIGSCDCPYKGPTSSWDFAIVTKPPAAAVAATGDQLVVTLPATQTGQTGWLVTVDNGNPVPIGLDPTYTLVRPAAGKHSIGVARVAGDGQTSAALTSVTVP